MFRRALALSAVAVLAFGCVEQSPDAPTEEDIKLAHENVLSAPPAKIQYPANADLEDKLTYLGLDVDTETVVPGKPFTLTHYWRVNKTVPADWKMFVHLEAPDSKKSHLNADHIPVGGKYPLQYWKPGEIIRDAHRVSVPASWPGNSVEIYVGLWKGSMRMKVTSGNHDAENRAFAVKLPLQQAAPPEHKKLIARHIKNGLIKADGKIDEPAWKTANSTGDFVRSTDGNKADQKTTAQLLWDDKNLYVAFQMEDKDVWSTLSKPDDKLWTQEAVEIFIDADGDGKTYVELQTNPLGAVYDSWLPVYRQNQNDWQSNMKVGVKVDGTLDNRSDVDKGWTVEMAIPLTAALGKEKDMKNVPPKVGSEWRINLFRLDMPNGHPQQGSAWSPPMVGDFHALDRFGVLEFGDDKGNFPVVAAADKDTKDGKTVTAKSDKSKPAKSGKN